MLPRLATHNSICYRNFISGQDQEVIDRAKALMYPAANGSQPSDGDANGNITESLTAGQVRQCC